MSDGHAMNYLQELFGLQNKIAVVTGAAGGIGQAITNGLLHAGATVVLVDRDQPALDQIVRSFTDKGLAAIGWKCDLACRHEIDALVAFVTDKFSRIDIIVNNAGVTFTHTLVDYPDDLWRTTLQVNLEAPFYLVRGFAPMMRHQCSGSIINITSINAELGFPDNPAYQAAKGGLKQLTKSLATDLGPFCVRVNNVGPGYCRTNLTQRSWSDARRRQQCAQHTLLGRWAEPNDIVGLVVFLASDASAYITGQDVYVDGGWTIKGW